MAKVSGFAALLPKDWTKIILECFEVLQDAIRQAIETGKAVAIAVKPKKALASNWDGVELMKIAPNG